MNTKKHNSALRGIAVILTCLGLIACGGGNVVAPPAEDLIAQPQPVAPVADNGVPENPTEPRATNVLRVQTPVLTGLPVGTEFEVSLSGSFTQSIYQGSFRLQFDPAVMQPVEANRGDLLAGRMVHLAGLNENGFVPFSFTALPGEQALTPGSGDLLNVRFRLLAVPDGSPRVKLQNDVQYLQLRDSRGKRLLFDLETSAGGVQ